MVTWLARKHRLLQYGNDDCILFLGKELPHTLQPESAGLSFLLAMLLFGGITLTHRHVDGLWSRLLINTALIGVYAAIVIGKEYSRKTNLKETVD